MTAAPPIVVRGGGSSAGILLVLLAIIGLLALFSGKLESWIDTIGGGGGQARTSAALARPLLTPGEQTRVPTPTPAPPRGGGGQATG